MQVKIILCRNKIMIRGMNLPKIKHFFLELIIYHIIQILFKMIPNLQASLNLNKLYKLYRDKINSLRDLYIIILGQVKHRNSKKY
jgi:hypothetical protein